MRSCRRCSSGGDEVVWRKATPCEIRTIQRRSAWTLRKDGTQQSRMIQALQAHTRAHKSAAGLGQGQEVEEKRCMRAQVVEAVQSERQVELQEREQWWMDDAWSGRRLKRWEKPQEDTAVAARARSGATDDEAMTTIGQHVEAQAIEVMGRATGGQVKRAGPGENGKTGAFCI
eukprot:scaffold305301_cov17-Tisochrysis_lutea.AAC.1